MNLPKLTAHTFESYLESISNIPILSVEEEIELARKYRYENDVAAAYKLTMSNLRMVVYLAREYSGYGIALEELVQEGNIGLMKAVKKFDPEQGVRLASYAVHWIKSEIYEFITKNWKIVKMATTKSQRKLFFNMRKYVRDGNSYTDKDIEIISKSLDVPEKDVRAMEHRIYTHDIPVDHHEDDDDHHFNSAPYLLVAPSQYNPLDSLLYEESKIDMGELLSCLSDRERDIVQSRYLEDDKATFDSLAVKYEVSLQRIEQIERAALKKIKLAFA